MFIPDRSDVPSEHRDAEPEAVLESPKESPLQRTSEATPLVHNNDTGRQEDDLANHDSGRSYLTYQRAELESDRRLLDHSES